MKILICTLALCGYLSGSALALPLRQDPEKPKAVAAAMIDNLAKGDFIAAGSDFEETLEQQIPPGKLKAVWLSVTAAAGAYQKRLEITAEPVSRGTMVSVICVFEKKPMKVKLSFSAEQRINGLWFLPAPSGLPGYADAGQFTEEEFSFTAQGTTLNGTLTLPKGAGPFKAVLLVHGSGPNNRDEEIGPNKPFRDIAAGLASRGIAVYRYDKRRGPPPGVAFADGTIKEEVLDDALAAAAALRADRRIKPDGLYVLGHSLGGQLAPLIAQLDGKLAGIVVAAGPVRPFGATLLRQITYLAELDGTVTDAERARIEALKKQAPLIDGPELNGNTPAKDLPPGLTPKYLLSLRSSEPVKTAAGLQVPILLLQGERDYQVTMEDFSLWREGLAGKPDAVFKSYPGLNHLFLGGEGPGNPAEYHTPGNVETAVINDITSWLK